MDEISLSPQNVVETEEPGIDVAAVGKPGDTFAEPLLNKPGLRIGIMLDSFTVQAWQAKILDDMATEGAPEIRTVMVSGSLASPSISHLSLLS